MPRTTLIKTEPENENIEKEAKVKKKKFEKDDYIPCRSITVGLLCLDGIKTKTPYKWADYGDISDVEYQDLLPMVRSRSNNYVYGPLFIIEDDDFINEFPELRKFYDDQYTVGDLESILNLPVRDMVKEIEHLPNGAKESLKSIASTQISTGKLDSVKKIKALDELFGTQLNLLSELFGDS